MYRILFLLVLCFGCSNQEQPVSDLGDWLQISGRTEGNSLERQPIYRVKIPKGWIVQAYNANEALEDTTKPLMSL